MVLRQYVRSRLDERWYHISIEWRRGNVGGCIKPCGCRGNQVIHLPNQGSAEASISSSSTATVTLKVAVCSCPQRNFKIESETFAVRGLKVFRCRVSINLLWVIISIASKPPSNSLGLLQVSVVLKGKHYLVLAFPERRSAVDPYRSLPCSGWTVPNPLFRPRTTLVVGFERRQLKHSEQETSSIQIRQHPGQGKKSTIVRSTTDREDQGVTNLKRKKLPLNRVQSKVGIPQAILKRAIVLSLYRPEDG
jgi:hypothetical protein